MVGVGLENKTKKGKGVKKGKKNKHVKRMDGKEVALHQCLLL